MQLDLSRLPTLRWVTNLRRHNTPPEWPKLIPLLPAPLEPWLLAVETFRSGPHWREQQQDTTTRHNSTYARTHGTRLPTDRRTGNTAKRDSHGVVPTYTVHSFDPLHSLQPSPTEPNRTDDDALKEGRHSYLTHRSHLFFGPACCRVRENRREPETGGGGEKWQGPGRTAAPASLLRPPLVRATRRREEGA